jgi:cytochrome b
LISGRAGNQVTAFHAANFNVLLGVVILHIVAVFLYLLVKRENLIAPMFTGSKDDPHGSFEQINSSQLLAAGIVLLLAAASVYAVVTLL